MGCAILYQQLHNVDRDLDTLRRLSVEESHPAFQDLWRQRGSILSRVGQKSPRDIISISHEEVLSRLQALGLEYAGGSPGYTAEELKDATVRIWYDIESGWMSEGRMKPGGPPIYHMITAEVAVDFIKHQETPEMIAHALTEDEYIGE
jgi:hypothetical protein